MLAGLAARGNVKCQCRRTDRHEVDAGHKGGNQALTCGRDASYCGTPLLPCPANFLCWPVLGCAHASHACSLHMTIMCCVEPLINWGCGAWQDAIKACPEGQRPEVLVSTSAIGALLHDDPCFVVSLCGLHACML